MKRLVRGGFLFLFLFLCSMQTAAAASIRIFLDDKAVSFAEAPFIENDRVLVPMRGILESLGYSVAWQEESKTVLAEKDEIQISLHPDEKTAIVNGKAVCSGKNKERPHLRAASLLSRIQRRRGHMEPEHLLGFHPFRGIYGTGKDRKQ